MQKNKTKLCIILGPTATGKTKLAVQLAKKYGTEIISADSMQIYKEINIATAKATDEEMCGIKHHLLGFLSVEEAFSVAQYVKLAHEKIYDINKKNKLPIMVGGTGLYINSVADDINFTRYNQDGKLRAKLKKRALEDAGESLYKELCEIDPESAKKIERNDLKRIIRAIEIYTTSGKTMTQQIENSKPEESRYDVLMLGLNFKDRQKLYEKINIRVDNMLENGLINEAEILSKLSLSKTANMAIGYKELLPYLSGKCSLKEASEKIKQNSRNYAKRQLTWFKRDKRINWLYVDEYGSFSELVQEAERKLEAFL